MRISWICLKLTRKTASVTEEGDRAGENKVDQGFLCPSKKREKSERWYALKLRPVCWLIMHELLSPILFSCSGTWFKQESESLGMLGFFSLTCTLYFLTLWLSIDFLLCFLHFFLSLFSSLSDFSLGSATQAETPNIFTLLALWEFLMSFHLILRGRMQSVGAISQLPPLSVLCRLAALPRPFRLFLPFPSCTVRLHATRSSSYTLLSTRSYSSPAARCHCGWREINKQWIYCQQWLPWISMMSRQDEDNDKTENWWKR